MGLCRSRPLVVFSADIGDDTQMSAYIQGRLETPCILI